MKLFKIAFSNIKKRKSSAITLLVIAIISALMLTMSLTLLLNTGRLFDRKRIELNAPDASYFIATSSWEDSMLDLAKKHNLKDAEVLDMYGGSVVYKHGNDKAKIRLVIFNEDSEKTMNVSAVIDKLKTKPVDSIVLPLSFKYNGFKAGDKFEFSTSSESYVFTVYGFVEDAISGASMTSENVTYVSSDSFAIVSNDATLQPYKFLGLKFHSNSAILDYQAEFSDTYGNAVYTLIEGNMTKMAATTFSLVMSLVMILVSLIILIIAIIIIRFTIINTIQEDIKTLGALKSIGYTSKQIIISMLLQFLMLTIAGTIIGALLALAVAGFIGNIISSTMGLLWNGISYSLPIIISILAINLIAAGVAYLVARKAKSVTPINALREGMSNHSFKKNYAPFETSRLPLNTNIALKHVMGNLKNNIVTFIIVILFAFLTVVTCVLYHNFVTDKTAFKTMIGQEISEIMIITTDGEFASEKFPEIAEREHIRKTLKSESISLKSEGIPTLQANIWEDISKKEIVNLVDGKYPSAHNEIVITASLAKIFNKNRGDMLAVEYNGQSFSYLITGTIQGVGIPAYTCEMTLEGFHHLKPDAVLKQLYIYLDNNDPDFISDYIDSLAVEYGRDIMATNMIELINGMLESISSPVAMATYLIMVITIFIICFVLFLMINTLIRRTKRDAGIMKALGFTSRQLIFQTLLSYLPIVILGVGLGALFGILLTNPILGIMFSGMGIAKAKFAIPGGFIAVAEIILFAVCLLTIYLVSLKLKRIEPHKLIAEQ